MPLRSDPTVWYNMPGVVAAYQPIAAPGPLLARYNQAHGGDNRYKAVDGIYTPPAWDAVNGWKFLASTNAYYITGITPGSGWSAIVRFSNDAQTADRYILGSQNGTGKEFWITGYFAGLGGAGYANGTRSGAVAPYASSGVLAIAGGTAYRNGVQDYAGMTGTISTAKDIYIGAIQTSGGSVYGNMIGYIQAVVVYSVTLSPSAVWHASRQMDYCHVNPDWSAWGRKRRYYYAPAQATFQAAWARNSNTVIQAGK